MSNLVEQKRPTIIRLGKVEELTHGNGYTYTDYLGDPTTRYGTYDATAKKPKKKTAKKAAKKAKKKAAKKRK